MWFFGIHLFGTLCVSSPEYVSFLSFGEFSAIISTFSAIFFLSSSSGTPIMQMLVHLLVFQRSLKLHSLFKTYFYFCCSDWAIFILLSSRLLTPSSVSLNMLLIPSCVLFVSTFVFLSCNLFVYLFQVLITIQSVLLFFPHILLAFWALYVLNFHLCFMSDFFRLLPPPLIHSFGKNGMFNLLCLYELSKIEIISYVSLEAVSFCGNVPVQFLYAQWFWWDSWIWHEHGVCWPVLPWWQVGLEIEQSEPVPDVSSASAMCSGHHCPTRSRSGFQGAGAEGLWLKSH